MSSLLVTADVGLNVHENVPVCPLDNVIVWSEQVTAPDVGLMWTLYIDVVGSNGAG